MAEEWPRLRDLLDQDQGLRVCVLCSYRAPLKELQARLALEVDGSYHRAGLEAAEQQRR